MAEEKKEHADIYAAMFAVQTSVDVVKKTADNPFFKSKYADLPAVWEVIKDTLKENGLLVYNVTSSHDGVDYLKTHIRHIPSGTEISSVMQLHLQKPTSQEYGSCITYMRRYALSSMLGLITDKDDDGNDASQTKKAETKKPEPKKEDKSQPPKPVDGNEFLIMQNGIKAAKDMEALKVEWAKIAAAIKAKRLNDAQIKALEKEKDKRKLDLDEIPTDWDEQGNPK